MFILKYFKNSIFSLKGIYELKSEKVFKILIYFIFMSLLSLLPHNIEIIREKGFKLGFISEVYKEDNKTMLINTKAEVVGFAGLRCSDDFKVEYYEFKDYDLVIDYNNEYDIKTNNKEKAVLILQKTEVLYYDQNRAFMRGNYDSFDRDIRFSELRFNDSIYQELFTNLEKSFYSYIIFFSIINNVMVQTGMYLIMIILMAIILSFLKYGFSKKMKFIEIVKILVLSMTLPSVIVFILGWFGLFGLTPVIMNFMIGGIGLLVMTKVAKNRVELECGK